MSLRERKWHEMKKCFRVYILVVLPLLWHICSRQELWSQQRQPLLGNDSENMPVARQQLRNTRQWSNWEAVFSTRSVPKLYRESIVCCVLDGCLTPRQTGLLTVGRNITLTLTLWVIPRLEGGSNTSTISLRDVGGEEKRLRASGITGPPGSCRTNTGDLALQVGGVSNLRQ
jgi:hypothetical protein